MRPVQQMVNMSITFLSVTDIFDFVGNDNVSNKDSPSYMRSKNNAGFRSALCAVLFYIVVVI